MLIQFAHAPIELRTLRVCQRKGLVLSFSGDVVPEFLHDLDLLGRGELKEFLAKGLRRHVGSLPLVSNPGKSHGVDT